MYSAYYVLKIYKFQSGLIFFFLLFSDNESPAFHGLKERRLARRPRVQQPGLRASAQQTCASPELTHRCRSVIKLSSQTTRTLTHDLANVLQV